MVSKKKIVGLEKNCKLIKLEPEDFTKNPYIQNIHIGKWQIGNVYLNNSSYYEERKTYIYNARKRDKKTLNTIFEHCYFQQDMHFPTLGTIFPYTKWKGVEPAEINTFNAFIKEAKGKVLLIGCGLGYVAYMLSLKEDINEITIVELDNDVKTMFEVYLKPQMNNKISIIKADAFEFLEKENISMYQYCSVDIWHDALDMAPLYLKCLLLEQKHPKTKFHYWLEEDLHNAFENTWLRLLKNRIMQKNMENNKNIFTDILRKQNLDTIEDIKNFMIAPKRPIIKEWVLSHPEEAIQGDLIRTLKRIEKKL